MVTIKVFSVEGVKELKCFDTLSEIPYMEPSDDEVINELAEETDDGF